jgi:opacity protein-like surface antigen
MNNKFLNSKAIVCICFLVMSIFTVAQAQEVQEAQVKQEKQRKFYLSLGGSAHIMSDNVLGGGNLTFGFMPSPKNLFTFEVVGGGGESIQIGSYGYSYYEGNVLKETRNDGKITYGYSLVEVMLTWNYLFNISEKWKFRLGPTIGTLVMIGSDSYSPTSYKGIKIEGIPESQSETHSALNAGIIAGFQWNFTKRWFFDLNYRLTGNTDVDFKERTISTINGSKKIDSKDFGNLGHRINLAIGVRL